MSYETTLARCLTAPTIRQGQTDDLIYESQTKRVWRSRMTVADGMPYDDQITVEVCGIAGGGRHAWTIQKQFNPRAL